MKFESLMSKIPSTGLFRTGDILAVGLTDRNPSAQGNALVIR